MDIDKLSIEEVLGMAVKTEVQGRKFYLMLADKVTNPEVKQKVISLARDEERHEAMIRGLYKEILGKEPDNLPEKGIPDIVAAIKSMDITEKTELLRLLDMAIEAELLAAKFYDRGAKLTPDPRTKNLFIELAAEEDGHYNMLVAEKAAIAGDHYWFSSGDSSMMEE